MAKKSVDADKAAYASKGRKLPRPGAGPKLDPSMAPSSRGKNSSKGQSIVKDYSEYASMAPKTKGVALTSAEAPAGVNGVNGGESLALPYSGKPGESDV